MSSFVPQIVQFSAPNVVELVDCDQQALTAGAVRVRTWYSGISAGTELTAYRGSTSDRVADLDRWGLDTTRRLLATAPPASPFPESLTSSA